jgi:thiol-disulfide isomerase/thioredoxin
MAETPSAMLPLGTPLPALRLTDPATGAAVDPAGLAHGKRGLLVAFICNHCPYVLHIRPAFVRTAHAALDRGLAVVAVNSNDAEAYPQDGPEEMVRLAKGEGWRFPFLFDEPQEAARAMRAACTPDLFLFDAGLRLAYRGQFDDSRPGNGKPVTGASLEAAIDAVLAGREPPPDQRPSIGCSIKWRPGSSPLPLRRSGQG